MTYTEVVEKAKAEIHQRLEQDSYGNKKVKYVSCLLWENGNQINLWSYWQGYQIPDIEEGIDILLVGQDWGNPSRNSDSTAKIELVQTGKEYVIKKETNPTNKALIDVFKLFDCDITRPVYDKRIFFTNYSLGYRDGSEQGGMTKTLMKQDAELFKNLVDAIHPGIIICLGKIVYECVVEKTALGWIKQLKSGKPFEDKYPHDDKIKVYGVAHCGARGINNIGGSTVNEKAWKKIADDYLESHG